MTQVALALVLLVGAGLFMKSLSRLRSVEPGFNSNNLLTMRVSLPGRKYDTDPKVMNFSIGPSSSCKPSLAWTLSERLTRFRLLDHIRAHRSRLKGSQSFLPVRNCRRAYV